MSEQNVLRIDTPILLLGYNRPDNMRKLIEALRPMKPTRIYMSVDGPKIHKEADQAKVLATQELRSEIDWDCHVETRFLDINYGCKIAISSAIDWLFEHEECGIILEDDCIPTQEFIIFAARMLSKYEQQEQVMHISGNSFFPNDPDYEFNHYFSKLFNVWGWATWKRAWDKFEFNSQDDLTINANKLISNYYQNRTLSNWFLRYYRESLSQKASAWSPHWVFSVIRNGGLAVTPMANLVKNIGFTYDSTHASSKSFQAFNDFKIGGLPNLSDPKNIVVEDFLDRFRFKVIRKTDPNLFFLRRLKLSVLPKVYRVLPNRMKTAVKKVTSRSEILTKFLQE